MEFNQADYDLINKEFEELRLVSLKRCASQHEYEEVLRAFKFANEAHKGVRRRSGEPYILHPIAVGKIVVQEIGLGYKSIVAALIHDIVEDTDYTLDDIKRLFGEKVTSLVDGLTKITAAMSSDTSETLQAENFKRIILTLSDDVRVVLIKLADRLHNVRTIEYMPEHKKDKILSETMYIFVPLAHRLGLYSIKSEMENIWLRNREPEAYSLIQAKLDESLKLRGESIEEFMQSISIPLESKGYRFEIYRRTKTPYSIWKKMETKSIPFEEIFDIHAVRIIFQAKKNEEEHIQCWNIYALITKLYSSKTNRIRDWVSQPKSNGYEALHCTVMSRQGNWMEIQIRSERMNDIAEKGVASHWNYKENASESGENELDNWLNMVRDVLENPDVSALEFLDKFHDRLTDSDIYIYTPKGDTKSIQKGSTALDFAYSIHSEIGNKAIAAKINLRLMPLSRILKNGDQVQIITAESQTPQREWMDFLHTAKAKSVLQDALKDNISCTLSDGRNILIQELAKYGVKPNSKVIKKLLLAYKVNAKEELYNKISTGLVRFDDLENILRKNDQNKNVIFWTLQLLKSSKEKELEEYDEEDAISSTQIHENSEKLKNTSKKKYLLEENPIEQTLSYRAADCCYPIPGDNVVTFLDDNGDMIIHKKICKNATNLATHKGNRIVNAKWSKHTVLSSLARVRIFGVDRIGILNELTKYTTLVLNINIRKVSIETHDGIFEGFIDCYVYNTKDLDTLMKHLREIKGVETVSRVDIKEN